MPRDQLPQDHQGGAVKVWVLGPWMTDSLRAGGEALGSVCEKSAESPGLRSAGLEVPAALLGPGIST